MYVKKIDAHSKFTWPYFIRQHAPQYKEMTAFWQGVHEYLVLLLSRILSNYRY